MSEGKTSIPSISCLSRRPSNTSAEYCQTCSSSAIKCAEVFTQFNALRLGGELCDIAISVKSTAFNSPAHRLILATKSPFFMRYFTENKSATEFEFEDSFSADVVKSVLDYLYESELVVSSENIEDLTKIAVFLELSEVVDRCCHYITSSLSINNYERYISLSEELNLPWLLNKVFLYLEWNFIELMKSESFLRLKASQLYRLLSSKGLRVGREETLYDAVMKWYSHDVTNRKKSLESLFEKVHFIRMDPNFLEERVVPELVKDLSICEDKVSSAQKLHETSPSHTDVWAKGRSRNTSDAIYIFSSSEEFVERFDHVTSTCVPCPEMKLGASASGGSGDLRCAVRVNDSLFLVSSRKVLRLCTDIMRWKIVGNGVPVTDAGICGGEVAFYVVGGKQGNSVKRFLTEEQKWDGLPPLKVGRRGPGVVCLSNVLYVIGGYSTQPSGPTASVESLDLSSGEWSSLPSMLVPRFRLSCVTFNGKIFAMGGRDNARNLLTVETFDVESKKWLKPDKHMVCLRDEFCATVREGVIFCFGGRGERSVECFDLNSEGDWEEIGVMTEGKLKNGLWCVNFTPVFED